MDKLNITDRRASELPVDPHPFRLGRSFSLGRNKYYQQVYRRGKSTPMRHIVLVYLKARDMKVGFSASGKVGNAVTRNRVRRIMREDFRLLRPMLKRGKYIFVARPSAAKAGHHTLKAEMKALLERGSLFARGDEP